MDVKDTYRYCNLENLPICAGIFPDTWQLLKDLRKVRENRLHSAEEYKQLTNRIDIKDIKNHTAWTNLLDFPKNQEKNLPC